MCVCVCVCVFMCVCVCIYVCVCVCAYFIGKTRRDKAIRNERTDKEKLRITTKEQNKKTVV